MQEEDGERPDPVTLVTMVPAFADVQALGICREVQEKDGECLHDDLSTLASNDMATACVTLPFNGSGAPPRPSARPMAGARCSFLLRRGFSLQRGLRMRCRRQLHGWHACDASAAWAAAVMWLLSGGCRYREITRERRRSYPPEPFSF